MNKKLIYCILWSLGLFVATFPSIFEIDKSQHLSFFSATDIKTLNEKYIRPLVIAMALFLGDVLYNVAIRRCTSFENTLRWCLAVLIIFMFSFTGSIELKNVTMKYILFGISWVALTILKIKTTENEAIEQEAAIYEISNN